MDVGMAEAGQFCDEPVHRGKEGHPHQDTLVEIDLRGISPCRWRMDLMDRTPPKTGWTISGACGSVLGLFGTCSRLQEP